MNECIFCRIVAGSVPAAVVHEDEHIVAFDDIHPQAPVHVLVIPRKHLVSVAEFSADDDSLLATLVRSCVIVARKKGVADSGYRIVTNTGAEAGQSVFHVHFHLLGGRRLAWPPG